MHGSSDSVYAAGPSTATPDDSTVAPELRRPQPDKYGQESRITIVIVEDHQLVADGFRIVLNAIPELTVLDVANTCADGFLAVARHRPDVLLLDHWLPDGFGAEQIPALLEICGSMKILLVTADDSDAVVLEAINAGAVGVVVKGKRAPALIAAIRAAARGEAVVTPDVIHQIVRARDVVDQRRRDCSPHE
jgi:two-component system, NarL family, nitrate/nitrite response regulator NarL